MEPSKTTVITFAGSDAHKELQLEFDKLYANKFKRHIMYDRTWLRDSGFLSRYDYLFSYEKYCGYFIWKPLILLDALSDSEQVLYCDANLRFTDWNKFENSYKRFADFYILKYNHYFNKDWTKRDAFVLMSADHEEFWNANQVWSVLMGFEKTNLVQEVLEAYLEFCADPRIVTEIPNEFGDNLEGFVAHRWEQSIMSILVEMYAIRCPLYNDLLGVVDKIYPKAVLDLKAKVDIDPLKKVS